MRTRANKGATDYKHPHKLDSLGLGSIKQIHCYSCTPSLGRALTNFNKKNFKFLHHFENVKFQN